MSGREKPVTVRMSTRATKVMKFAAWEWHFSGEDSGYHGAACRELCVVAFVQGYCAGKRRWIIGALTYVPREQDYVDWRATRAAKVHLEGRRP